MVTQYIMLFKDIFDFYCIANISNFIEDRRSNSDEVAWSLLVVPASIDTTPGNYCILKLCTNSEYTVV